MLVISDCYLQGICLKSFRYLTWRSVIGSVNGMSCTVRYAIKPGFNLTDAAYCYKTGYYFVKYNVKREFEDQNDCAWSSSCIWLLVRYTIVSIFVQIKSSPWWCDDRRLTLKPQFHRNRLMDDHLYPCPTILSRHRTIQYGRFRGFLFYSHGHQGLVFLDKCTLSYNP